MLHRAGPCHNPDQVLPEESALALGYALGIFPASV
jgi:hypothetical protein